MSLQNHSLDQVTLVDERDQAIGSMDKVEAHRGEAKRHRAISAFLLRKAKKQTGQERVELLIQQRSEQKIVGANQWANTVCGNVRPKENYEHCAYRRLKEELGIREVNLQPMYTFEYHLKCNAEFSEWEIDQVFVGQYDGEVNPNPDEAQAFAWIDWEELLDKVRTGQTKAMGFNELEVQLTDQLTKKIENYHLTPWFVWMLRDEKLIRELQKKINIMN